MNAYSVAQLHKMRSASETRDWALLDVRERGEADACHIFGASSVPRRQLEYRIADLVPAQSTRIVVYDDGDGRAELAAATLRQIGYAEAGHLDGGLPAWRAAGHPVISGSNVPSKAFGERVHTEEHPQALTALEVKQRMDAGENMVICDVRTPGEYQEGHIPGGYEAPSFDLVLNAYDLARKHDTVIVNCAGRTRSIIAARTLHLLGIENAYAMENGTSGWLLEDLALERDVMRQLDAPSAASAEQAKVTAARLADQVGVGIVSNDELATRIAERGARNVYAYDVRSLDTYRDGHIPGTAALPGGQAIQRADDFFAVPDGEILLVDDDDARAALTGYWLRRIGYPHVSRLAGGLPGWRKEGRPVETGRPRSEPRGLAAAAKSTSFVDAASAREMIGGPTAATVIDVGPSRQFAQGHLPGARWLPRGWLELRIGDIADKGTALLVTAREESQAVFAAATLAELGYRNVTVLRGGTPAWRAAGETLGKGEPAEEYGGADYVLPPYQQGKEGMLRYLKWEIELVEGSGPAVEGRL
ncbi:rhodanese-like domain-containing protein [Oceanibacterium hippocampi]|uniref:Thiosulfate sulfurtransferase n=1 Tax=Oceanibacterium hippocampi TaxID=745714 RepID=A0A1Y5TXM6_9PROT|nr:rhodanese-like domain-containing protein [Oceanibacterium hippocampi]SLN72635.1 Thiosulfate sulfurtransferase [Oceanibacterium hippocampi]